MRNKISLAVFLMFILSTSFVLADNLQVWVTPTAHFQTGENVTFGGRALDSNGEPIINRNVSITVYNPSNAQTNLGTFQTDSSGEFSSSTFTATSTSGEYLASVMLANSNPLIPPTLSFAFFFVEPEREYQVITNKFIYDLEEVVSITVNVNSFDVNNTRIPEANVNVPLKIFSEDGTLVVDEPSLTTGVNGTITTTYTIPNDATSYGTYFIDVKSGKTSAAFKVPYFDVKLKLLNQDSVETTKFGTSNNLSVKITITKEGSGGDIVPVSGVQTVAVLKSFNEETAGNTIYTFTADDFTESDGVYTSSNYELGTVQSGDYYVEVTATKTNAVTKSKYLTVNNLNLELEPIFPSSDITTFLKEDTAFVGINMIDLSTGEPLASNKLTAAEITGCKKDGKDCMSSFPNSGVLIDSEDEDFTKLLNFTTSNIAGSFELTIRVNTTDTYISGKTYITIQDVFSTANVEDRFANIKWKVRSGESVSFNTEAWLSSNLQSVVNSVTVIECVDEDGADVTDEMISSDGSSTDDSSIGLSAPTDGGCYTCELQVNSANGTSYTSEQICVQKYDIWASSKKLSNNNWDWAWRFDAESNAYFHVQVLNDAYQQIAASKLDVELTKLTNVISGQTYNSPAHSVLATTSEGVIKVNATTGNQGQPIINVSLNNLNLASGFYSAEIEVTDDEGSVDSGDAFFQISNLDVFVDTKRSGSSAFIFKPSDTLTLDVSAAFFNGTNVPDGSSVSVDKLLLITGANPRVISDDVYTSTTGTTTSGSATLTLSPQSGKTLPSGDYLVFVTVNTGSISEIREAWFMVKSFFVYAYTIPYYYASPSTATDIYGFVFDPDWNAMNGVNISFDGFYDVQNFDLVEGITAPDTVTANWGSFTLNLNSTPSKDGTYVYVIKAVNSETGKVEEYMDYLEIERFSNIECSLVDSDQSVVTTSTSVNYRITMTDASAVGIVNQNVSVGKFTNVDSWSDRSATTTSLGSTSSSGTATLTVTAPNVIGRFRPILTVNGEELSGDTYAYGMWPCEIEVYTVEADVELKNDASMVTSDFLPENNISVDFMLSNPSGGGVDMNELKLVHYQCLTPDCRAGLTPPWTTTLGGSKTSNFAENNIMKFQAPEQTGTYLLVTQAEDTDGSTSTIPVTFNIVDTTFEYFVWLVSSVIGSSDDLQFNLETDGNLKLNITSILNLDNDQQVGQAGIEHSFSSGNVQVYNYSITGLTSGTYEAELCLYSETCTNNSDKRTFVFEISSSYFPKGRPYKPSGNYVTGENLTFEVKLENQTGDSEPIDNVTLTVLERSGQDFSSSFTTTVEDSDNPGWKKVSLSSNGYELEEGTYEVTFQINYDTTYETNIFFMVEETELELVTSDGIPVSDSGFAPPTYAVGEDIVFNITGSANESGKLYFFDTNGWVQISQYTRNFSLDVNGFNQTTISFNEGKNYVAVIAIPDLGTPGHVEEHYPFDIVAGFDIIFNWAGMDSEISADSNLTLNFTVQDIDGSPMNGGNINISVDKYLNPMNWNEINGSVGISNQNVAINADGSVVYEFDPNVDFGEYLAEITFEIGNNQRTLQTWFMIKSADFWVWSNKNSYNPGESVTLYVKIEDADGAGVNNQNVELTNVDYQGSAISSNFITSSTDTTDINGEAQLSFNLPGDQIGNFQARINWTETGDSRTVTISSTNLQVEVFEQNWPPFSGGDNYTLEVFVRDDDWQPLSGIPVNYTIRKEGDNYDWTIINDSVFAGNTGADGKVIINHPIPSDANGFYDMEIIIGNGAATRWRGYHVSPFDVYVNLYGEKVGESDTYQDWEIPSDATIVIPVEVRNAAGSGIPNATITLEEVRQMSEAGGVNVTGLITSITTSDVTGNNGMAELRFNIANLTTNKDYDVTIKVVDTGGTETYMWRWFKISAYSWDVQLTANPGLNDTSNYDVDSKGPGELVFVAVNLSGYDNTTKVCLERVESNWNWQSFWYDQCYDYDFLNSSNGAFTFNFSAPQESGNYEAIVQLRRYDDPNNPNWWMHEKEEWMWFEVLGGGAADYQFDIWSHSNNLWPSQNATFEIGLWDRQTWQDVNVSQICGNLTIIELRDSETWNVVKTGDELTQWTEQAMDPFGPSRTTLRFVVPNDLPAKEYRAEISCGDLEITREAVFRIASFQYAKLMPEFVRANQNISFWIKTTYYNGTPVANANVTVVELINNWAGGMVEQTFDMAYQTDANGEFVGTIMAPNNPSQYELVLTVTDGQDIQEIRNQFEVKGLDVNVDIDGGKKVLYEGDDATITVLVSNAQTGAPITNARVELDLMRHFFGGGEAQEFGEINCSSYNVSDQCFPEDGCWWNSTGPGICTDLNQFCMQYNGNEPNCQDPSMTQDNCWYDWSFDECRAVEHGGSFGGPGGDGASSREEKWTNHLGTAEFNFAGSNALSKGEYELNINVDAQENGWFWTHKSFLVRILNLSLATEKLRYSPGENINVNVTAKYVNGTAVGSEYAVTAGIESSKFENMEEEMACMMKWDNTSCIADSNCEWFSFEEFGDCGCDITPSVCDAMCDCDLDCGGDPGGPGGQNGMCELKEIVYDSVNNVSFINGLANFTLTIPLNKTAGPIMLFIDIVDPTDCGEHNGEVECEEVEFLDGLLMVMSNGTSDFSISIEDSIVGANEFVSVNITPNDYADVELFALAPMARHMQSSQGVISMQELMGGGPESGKEDNYEGAIYLNPTAPTHTMLLARNRPADYVTLIPLQDKTADFMMGGNVENALLISYTVNSSAGECSRNSECDDGNNQTWDVCVMTECQHNNMSSMSCTSDFECPDDVNNNIYGVCDSWTGECMNITGQCSSDNEATACDDGNNQTIDFCDAYHWCVNEYSYNMECSQSSDCVSYPGANYTGFCEWGSCFYMPSDDVGCTSDSDCDSGEWCDLWDYQCHSDTGGNCECTSVSNCSETPYGSDTIAECWCWCEYYDASSMERLYAWNESNDLFGNNSGVTWGWTGNEGADEDKPFGGNPGADVVIASVANDSDYLYVQMGLGGFEWGGGLPYCGGSYPGSWTGMIKGENFVVYYNTTSGGSTEEIAEGADHKIVAEFTQSSSSYNVEYYVWAAGQWMSPEEDPVNYTIDCDFNTMDFQIAKTTIGMTSPAQIILATYMSDWETWEDSWTDWYCPPEGGDCYSIEYNSSDLNTLIDRVPNNYSYWQWTNDTGGTKDNDYNPPPGGSDLSVLIDTPDWTTFYVDNAMDNNVTVQYSLMGDLTEYNHTKIWLDNASTHNYTIVDNMANQREFTFYNLTARDYQLYVELVSHAGMEIDNDHKWFRVNISEGGGPELSVLIEAPNDGATLGQDDVFVRYAVSGNVAEYNRTEVFIDDGAWNITRIDDVGTHNYTFINVSEGDHNVTVKLVKNDASFILDKVAFTIDTGTGSAGLSGQVNGSTVVNATIELFNSTGDLAYIINTTIDGTFNIPSVVPGVYDINVLMPPTFEPYQDMVIIIDNVSITTNETMNIFVPHVHGLPMINNTPVMGLVHLFNGSATNFSILLNNTDVFPVNVSLDLNTTLLGDPTLFNDQNVVVNGGMTQLLQYTFIPSIIGYNDLFFSLFFDLNSSEVIQGSNAFDNSMLEVEMPNINLFTNVTAGGP